VATVYENSLSSQGLLVADQNGQQEPRRKKSSLADIKCGLKETERHEMNHMNNNNEAADGEPEKICETKERQKLGLLLCDEILM
jgi:hypothetical protein